MSLSVRKKAWINRNPIREWRTAEGVDLAYVATKVGVSIHTVHRWEAGAANPTKHFLSILSVLLNQDLKCLWPEWLKSRPVFGG
jgi:transcriptional regulator with XRE-family HTH domain